MSLLKKPSFLISMFQGILILIIIMYFIRNIKIFLSLQNYEKMVILLLFSISIGIHGISHNILEKTYNFNPLNKN